MRLKELNDMNFNKYMNLKPGDIVIIKPTNQILKYCDIKNGLFEDRKTKIIFHPGKMDLTKKKYFRNYAHVIRETAVILSDDKDGISTTYSYALHWLSDIVEKINKLLKL